MQLNIIGNTKNIMKTINENPFKKLKIRIHIKKKNAPTREYMDFIKSADNLIIDFNEKKLIIKTIKDWLLYHDQGLIILRLVAYIGFTEQVAAWLKKQGKKAEIIFIPRVVQYLENENANKYLFIGGEQNGELTKILRKKLATEQATIFFTNFKEAEAIQTSLNLFLFLKKAYIIELEDLCIHNNIDIGHIKKGLVQSFGYSFFHNKAITEKNNYFLEQASINQKKSILKAARKIIIVDSRWVINNVKKLSKKYHFKKIGVFGIDSISTIKMLSRLPIEEIVIYSEKQSSKFISQKVVYQHNPYAAITNVDILIILEYNDQFASISFKRMGARINNKLIIDKTNTFELEEMKALEWEYISKGRPKVYNSV